MKILKIGTTVYCVSKRWDETNKFTAQVIPAKIVGYINIEGEVHPVLKGPKQELNPLTNYYFTDIEEAVDKITTK